MEPSDALGSPPGPPVRVGLDGYDLWVDFASMADDGTLGLRVSPGDVVVVGSEDAVPARAQVISVDIAGAIVVKVIGDEAAVVARRP